MAAVCCVRSMLKFRPVIIAQKWRLTGIRLSSGASLQTTTTKNDELETHTGQKFEDDDYRRIRFLDKKKLVNTRFAIDLIHDDPVVVCTQRTVSSDSGGPLGHPKVYINLDPPGIHTCGYSGRKFVLKKYYDEKAMGPSITYDEYLRQVGKESDETGSDHH